VRNTLTTVPPRILPRVLIVDDSRMVRAVIIKHIRGSFDVREEADGEAGWQALLLDPSIQVVITDHTMPKLDGFQLIERIRASKITRIREIPVIMISGDEDEPARQRAKDLGASDFITKGIGTAELVSRLDVLVKLSRTSKELEDARAQAVVDGDSGLLSRAFLLRECEQALARSRRSGEEITNLLIGIDHFDAVSGEYGADAAARVLHHFTAMLSHSIRRDDSLARWSPDIFAILSPNAQLRDANSFALRLREAVEVAAIHVGQRTLRLTVSIGIANGQADAVETAEALLDLAATRLQQAMAQGGNRVVGAGNIVLTRQTGAAGDESQSIDRAIFNIEKGEADKVRPQLAEISRRLQPLLQLLESEHLINRPLPAVGKKLGGAGAVPANDHKS
jgi:two-component system cell cycle response regulator